MGGMGLVRRCRVSGVLSAGKGRTGYDAERPLPYWDHLADLPCPVGEVYQQYREPDDVPRQADGIPDITDQLSTTRLADDSAYGSSYGETGYTHTADPAAAGKFARKLIGVQELLTDA